ncbi:hypothetical protein SK128_023681, partial [Halocaridina rubra]
MKKLLSSWDTQLNASVERNITPDKMKAKKKKKKRNSLNSTLDFSFDDKHYNAQ